MKIFMEEINLDLDLGTNIRDGQTEKREMDCGTGVVLIEVFNKEWLITIRYAVEVIIVQCINIEDHSNSQFVTIFIFIICFIVYRFLSGLLSNTLPHLIKLYLMN